MIQKLPPLCKLAFIYYLIYTVYSHSFMYLIVLAPVTLPESGVNYRHMRHSGVPKECAKEIVMLVSRLGKGIAEPFCEPSRLLSARHQHKLIFLF